MRYICLLCVFMLSVNVMAARVSVTLRDGRGTIEGTVLETNDTHLVLMTEEGEQTLPWPALENRSIYEVHPALFNRLLAAAEVREAEKIEEKKAAGMVRIGDRWFSSEDLLKEIRLDVGFRENRGGYETIINWSSYRERRRDVRAECVVRLDWLRHDVTYDMQVTYTHWVRSFGDRKTFVRGLYNEQDRTYTRTIQKAYDAEIVVQTEPYPQYQITDMALTGIDEYGRIHRTRKTERAGLASDGWHIDIHINGHLVYTRDRAGKEEYYIVQKR